MTRRARPFTALLLLAALAAACESREPPPAPARAPAPPARAPASAWRTIDDSAQAALTGEDPALAAAVARARETAEDARRRWRDTPPDRRGAWGVKWRAPTTDGGRENVWVEPLAWSRFRVEGRLASPPQRELACGRGRDDLVGFPIEELVDWVRYERADYTGVREGGFTIDVMQARYGAASPPEGGS